MQTYLLAVDLFALVALFLELLSSTHNKRLWPLFLLVIGRSLALIFSLAVSETGQTSAIIGTLEIFSVFCVIWILTAPITYMPVFWQKLARLGVAAALLLTFLPLWPFWPVPFHIHSLIIAMFGTTFILISQGEIRWIHLASPLLLALANFINLLDSTSAFQLVSLLGYGVLIVAVHQDSLANKQQPTNNLVQDALSISWKRQRMLEVSAVLNELPNLNQSIEYIAQTMAQTTHSDQTAIFTITGSLKEHARLVTLYSPERPFHIYDSDKSTFLIVDCPPLHQVVQNKEQLLYSHSDIKELTMLYALWNEERVGPVLLQPLIAQGHLIGVLVLGNPVTHRPISESDMQLCNSLSSQIATTVEHRRRYLELEQQTRQTETKNTPNQKIDKTLENYISILELIDEGVVISDTTGCVQIVNQAAERILGKPRQNLIGRPIKTLSSQLGSEKTIADMIAANKPLSTFIENDKQAIYSHIVPYQKNDSDSDDDNNERLGLVLLFKDVTQELKADRARNDFVNALSSELNSSLMMVKGYSELISNSATGEYSPQQLYIQHIIQSNANMMMNILGNATELNLKSKEQITADFEKTEIFDIVDEACHDMKPLSEIREVKLIQNVDDQLPFVAVSKKHFRIMLDNLLSNACRFTPPGGQIRLRARIMLGQDDNNTIKPHLILTVFDNGVGIPKEELNRIFDPFYQIKDHSLDGNRGLGMGLTVVKKLVKLYNGWVKVESIPGQGSAFQIILPTIQK